MAFVSPVPVILQPLACKAVINLPFDVPVDYARTVEGLILSLIEYGREVRRLTDVATCLRRERDEALDRLTAARKALR